MTIEKAGKNDKPANKENPPNPVIADGSEKCDKGPILVEDNNKVVNPLGKLEYDVIL